MLQVTFQVNGELFEANEIHHRETTLYEYIRYTLGLPGTKAMCGEGSCGSCIVMVCAKRVPSFSYETFAVNSCLVLVMSCDGWLITTVEGIGNRVKGYSDEQKIFAKMNATQCGYCTPGFITHLHSLRNKKLTKKQLEKCFGSNTCRCTGYRSIREAINTFAIDASSELCQQLKDLDIEDLKLCGESTVRFERKYSLRSEGDWKRVKFNKRSTVKDNKSFDKPNNKRDIFNLFYKYGADSCILIDGNTGKVILEEFEYPNHIIDISGVMSLKMSERDQNFNLGANTSIEDCIQLFNELAATKPDFVYLKRFADHFELVANMPIRKIGSVAGNLMMKRQVPTYQSDLFVLFECVQAFLTIAKAEASRDVVPLMKFLNPQFSMKGKLIVEVKLPPLSQKYILRTYKIMPRHQNSLAIVNAAFLIEKYAKGLVKSASIVYGSLAPNFYHAEKTEKYLVGKIIYENETLQQAINLLNEELDPKENIPEPSPECRKRLAISLFYKFVLNISNPEYLRPNIRSGAKLITRPPTSSKQHYIPDPTLFPFSQPIPILDASIKASGEAQFVSDIPLGKRDVFGAFVLSVIHKGEVDAVDTSVLILDGVLGIYTAKDIPGVNSFTYPGLKFQTKDEQILATSVKFYGQPVAIVVAITEELAAQVAKKVKVTYKNVSKEDPVLNIEQVGNYSKRYIQSNEGLIPLGRGTNIKKKIEGTYKIDAQYHYYMEPLSCVVVPVDETLEVYDSTQYTGLTQIAIARCLRIKESDVVMKVRRIGGGFGGKISRSVQVATACALVAKKMNRTCRFILPLHTNLAIAGKSLSCQCKYKAGVDDNGKIQYLIGTIVENKGCSINDDILSFTVGGYTNCYDTKYFLLETANVLTDLPSNTFARASGTFQGIACIEHIMEHIARAVGKDPLAVRLANMRTNDNDLPQIIEEIKFSSSYDERVKEIEKFNQTNRWMKKAIQISVMSFPMEYYGNYSATVSIYSGDGTVTITTGGIEMGQGCNTKAAQICAYELDIPIDQISIITNHSFAAANNVFSGPLTATESVCFSVEKACGILNSRLAPVRAQLLRNATWKDIIKKAESDQIDLTAEYMAVTDSNRHNYTAFSVAVTEVQLDVLTGKFEILRTDINEDCGLFVNPIIDIGQIEGAYVQGIGCFTTEKLVFDKKSGRLLTNKSLNYHVPLIMDTPIDFRVELRKNSKNNKGVIESKSCEDMGMCLSHGVTHALRRCIMESRKDSGYDTTEWIDINIPYDVESILKALNVKYEEFVLK